MAIHPILVELKLAKPNSKRDKSRPLRPVDILQYLLDEKIVNDQQIKEAHGVLTQREAHSLQALVNESNAKEHSKSDDSARRRHVALRIFYDGANYTGLAQNVGSPQDQSVEKSLFEALIKARLIESREACGYSRCGRTDRGVSAAGQVLALRLKSAFAPTVSTDQAGQELVESEALPRNSYTPLSVWVQPRKKEKPRELRKLHEYSYDKILNNLLPPEIRVLGWTPVSEEFSARFSAITRTYRYFFLKGSLDLGAMRKALKLMEGNHDFRNFCKMDVEKVYNFERVIHSASIVEEDAHTEICYFLIVGQAFLWHQIRCIATILFYIGQGVESPSLITELLDVKKNPGKPAYQRADELPLVLHDCKFSNVSFGYSVENLWNLTMQSESQYERLVLSAARLRNNSNALRGETVSVEEANRICQGKVRDQNRYLRDVESFAPIRYEDPPFRDSLHTTWGAVLDWMKAKYGLQPSAIQDGSRTHVPVMKRFKGSTYEEKLASLKISAKRSQRYDENVIKKRKTKEEDRAFYKHMTEQGGTAH